MALALTARGGQKGKVKRQIEEGRGSEWNPKHKLQIIPNGLHCAVVVVDSLFGNFLSLTAK